MLVPTMSEYVALIMKRDFKKSVFNGYTRYTNDLRDVYVVKQTIVVVDKLVNRVSFYHNMRCAAQHSV